MKTIYEFQLAENEKAKLPEVEVSRDICGNVWDDITVAVSIEEFAVAVFVATVVASVIETNCDCSRRCSVSDSVERKYIYEIAIINFTRIFGKIS